MREIMGTRADRIHTSVITLLGVAVAVLVSFVLYDGGDFFTTALADRAHHPDYREYRPAGRTGHGLGILGSAMILLLLVYSLRKRQKFMQRWGRLGTWLRYHIFLGVAGPILITLHTSFKIEGLVAVSYWSMAAVALSGVFGRYLYQQIPRNVLGQELGSGDIEAVNEELLVTLADGFGMGDSDMQKLEDIALAPLTGLPALVGLMILPFINLFLGRRLAKAGFTGGAMPPARTWVLQTRRLELFHQIRDLFHWWHVFHKPFAIIMILVMIVHVGVAVSLGYTWI